MELVRKTMLDRTGKDIVAANMSDYFCDHYGVKKFKPLSPIIKSANFSVWQHPQDERSEMMKVVGGVKQFEEPTCVRDFYCGAAYTQQVQVGQSHKLAVFTDACITIRKDLPSIERTITPTEGNEVISELGSFAINADGSPNTALALAIYEPYEVCLGGYGFGIAKAIKTVASIMATGVGVLNPDDAGDAGINRAFSSHITAAAKAFNTAASMAKFDSDLRKVTWSCTFTNEEYVVLIAYMTYLIGSGKWTPLAEGNDGQRMMLYGWLVLHPDFSEARRLLHDNVVVNHVIRHVESYLTAVGKHNVKRDKTAMCCSSELHLFSDSF